MLKGLFSVMELKDRLDSMYKGVLIGATMLVPGISGGSMAMILGIYERLLTSVSSFSKNKKDNFVFLFLFAFSAGVGMLLLARPILSLLESYPKSMRCFFVGAVAGGIPAIWKQARTKHISWKCFVCIIIGLALVIGISHAPLNVFMGNSPLYLILAGIIAAAALVLPGISVSYFLLIMGLYHELMRAISSLDMYFLMPMGMGILLGILLVAKGLEFILKRYPQSTYLIILGFVIGSVAEVLPELPIGKEWIFCIIAFVIGCFFIRMLSEEDIKNKNEIMNQ